MKKKQKKETFLLVSLKEEKAKKLAQVISNQSCRKILDYLATIEDATETQISKELKIPISTVHYNLTHLEKGGLVEIEEFHYSTKGKEVNHYKLANKFIIISPKSTESIREKLTKRIGRLMPAILISVIIGGAIQFFNQTKIHTFQVASSASEMAAKAPLIEQDTVSSTITKGAQTATQTTFESISQSISQYPGYWFIAGIITFIILYLIWNLIKKK